MEASVERLVTAMSGHLQQRAMFFRKSDYSNPTELGFGKARGSNRGPFPLE
jgi:hypothetical protein